MQAQNSVLQRFLVRRGRGGRASGRASGNCVVRAWHAQGQKRIATAVWLAILFIFSPIVQIFAKVNYI